MSELKAAARENQAEQDRFPGLTALDVYKTTLQDDFQKLDKSFGSLMSRQDRNRDDVLDLDELKLGMFQQNHENEQDAITNKFLLKSYSDLAGLARSQFSVSPIRGISDSDITVLNGLNTASTRDSLLNSYRNEANFHVREAVYEGAEVGAVVGLAGTTAALSLMKFAPAKLRTPMAVAGVAAPIVGAFLGAQVNTYRHFAEAESFVREKDFRAAWLASHSDNKAITAPGVYQEVIDTRVANLMEQSSSLPDIDENGYVDRTELNMAIRSGFGNAKFNEFLEVNYNELELLSKTVTDRNNERGIGVLSMKLLSDRTYAVNHFISERRQTSSLTTQFEPDAAKLAIGLGLASGVAGAFEVAARFAPSKAKPLCHLGALVGFVGTMAVKATSDQMAAERSRADFLIRKEMALGTIRDRL